jgi:hypothetical protein
MRMNMSELIRIFLRTHKNVWNNWAQEYLFRCITCGDYFSVREDLDTNGYCTTCAELQRHLQQCQDIEPPPDFAGFTKHKETDLACYEEAIDVLRAIIVAGNTEPVRQAVYNWAVAYLSNLHVTGAKEGGD